MEMATREESLERFKQVYSLIENVKDDNFDMCSFGRQEICGTAACIGGHIVLSGMGDISYKWYNDEIIFDSYKLRSYLGLSYTGFSDLFIWSYDDIIRLHEVTKEMALERIKEYIDRIASNNNEKGFFLWTT